MSQQSQFRLLGVRRFAPFFWTQFLGAMNDNVFKVAFTSLVTYHAALFEGVDPHSAAFLISAIFIAPFVLFSATSGQIADKIEKSRLIRLVKSLEIGIMLIGLAGFYMHSATLLYAGTFLMGLHSTLFGPVKFAYLPQHLDQTELVGGNGLVEMGTFVAILLGTLLGGELAGLTGASGAVVGPLYVGIICVVIAVAGRTVSQGVPVSPAPQPDLRINWNPFTETWRNLVLASQSRVVFLSLLGISWLWFLGATFLTSFFSFAKDVLGGDQNVVTLLLAVFSVGIGIGSLLCERLSGRHVEIGLVPFGSIGMTVFAVDLYFATHGQATGATLSGVGGFLAQPGHWRVLVDLFCVAMFGGFYSVPLYALIQSRSAPTHRARIIAANNILNSFFMIAASLLGVFMTQAGYSIPQLFLVVGLLNAVVAIYIYTLVPEFLLRFIAWLLVHTIYRLRRVNAERIPEEGAAVLVCNHVSFADAVVLMAASPRPVRFVMDHNIFKVPGLSWFFRQAKAIPIASARENPELLARAYDAVAAALADGELVCIFPEGKITANGDINPFKTGVSQIIQRTPVPVVPMALRGLWGSFFSRKGAPAMTRPFRRGLLSKLELVVGEPVSPEAATPEGLQQMVLALRGDWK
ncbi:MFS transporter [Cupriavidus sp.]|uniref:MFS transporter n=1 Tax=Cupriavidus sp. TaxID=1873897 RepID=UPI0025C4D792|nr:MFS transporter [Cupriavidus sp.]MCA3182430.1 MFS transporter [Cupriavidus sp.]MCA3189534.1 MFS transporter [Cupriavidus sp.]MCA3195614.1 MFS transporter [Cupriavidus sp.]MCA3201169.1 MFS transporter [Cupriavidus sp.]MCA3207431.1 MFS transporter [Cupriavidus sp.]